MQQILKECWKEKCQDPKKNLKKTLEYAPDLSLTFLYAHPQKLDEVRQTLVPVLGEKQLIIAAEENVENSLKKFAAAIGR